MKKDYRNSIKILYDILTSCTQECSVSRIGLKANLSYHCLEPIVARCVKIGYLIKIATDGNTRYGTVYHYKITDKGYRFAANIEEFANAP